MGNIIDFPRYYARFITKLNLINELFYKDISNHIILLYIHGIEITVTSSKYIIDDYHLNLAYQNIITNKNDDSKKRICLFKTFMDELPIYVDEYYLYIRIYVNNLEFPLKALEPYIENCLKYSKYKRFLAYDDSISLTLLR